MDRLLAHPLPCTPYDKITFVGFDHNHTALYTIAGSTERSGAFDALRRAFERWGGKCFYCGAKFVGQRFSNKTVGRDHVRPKSKGGLDLLHNLVIACRTCDLVKGNDPIHEFRPKAARKYLAALEDHIANSIEQSCEKQS